MSTPELSATDLTFRYGAGPFLGPLNLSLGVGLHELRGVNGTGKSTLMKCMCGEFEPTSGSVRVCGHDPAKSVTARSMVGFAPFPDDLPDFLTVKQYYRYIAAFRQCPSWSGDAICQQLSLPPDLSIGHASAGQRRKAGILISLVGDPPVVLLDEPWAAIDRASVEVVNNMMESLRKRCVVLFTTHQKVAVDVDSIHAIGER
ncbi:MAG: ATP-binding cassette domain-containing protein [Granulosicoccus sp.]